MLDFSEVRMELLTLHKVGNKAKNEDNLLANDIYEPSEELRQELMTYFLLPFKSVTEVYRFHHSSDLDYNEVNGFCSKIFKRKDAFLSRARDIVTHLYEQSEHPNIKTGEVCVAYFVNLVYEDELLDAVGIFKSERKESFLQFKKSGDSLVASSHQGIHARKLDKGCLVLNSNTDQGFRVLTIDNNNYDAEYWRGKFLDIEDAKDYNYQTRNCIDLVKNFSEEVIEPVAGKKEGISFVNQSIKYLAKNDTFEIDEFAHEVIGSEELRRDFTKYKTKFEKNFNVEISDEFEISKPTLRTRKKRLKNQINLDTKIQIKLGFDDAEGEKFIERGYDDRKKMHYYKIYFNQETE